MGKSVCCDAHNPGALDRPAARGSGGRLSRKGHGISQGDGGSRTLWKAMLEVWRKDSANSLRRQRNELLCAMPDWPKGSCRSRLVPAVGIGLASHTRRTRGPQASLQMKTLA